MPLRNQYVIVKVDYSPYIVFTVSAISPYDSFYVQMDSFKISVQNSRHICNLKVVTASCLLFPQVSPAQPTGGRRRRATEMDPDERRQRFLERNRAAASRCRQKRKLWVNSLEKKADDLANMNVSLTVSLVFLVTPGLCL